ncbi:hypothetical protein KY320_00590 [Candidatus Woesearchaeota archaeon]|nr:hypothetical protein [Candidatus Woesearchaeota archaeon]
MPKIANKTLVVYYSRTGTTRMLGEAIAKALKCDSEELIDKKSRKGILGWLKAGFEAGRKKLTKINPIKSNLDKYTLVLVGTPIWAANISPATRTFLAENKNKFKNVAFFATYGSDAGKCYENMEAVCRKKPVGCFGMTTKQVRSGDYGKGFRDYIKNLKA